MKLTFAVKCEKNPWERYIAYFPEKTLLAELNALKELKKCKIVGFLKNRYKNEFEY